MLACVSMCDGCRANTDASRSANTMLGQKRATFERASAYLCLSVSDSVAERALDGDGGLVAVCINMKRA